MKVFQSAKENLAWLGIISSQSNQKYPINVTNISVLLLFNLNLFANYMFLFIEAESFVDYTTGFYTTISSIVTCFDFIILIWVATKLFKFMEYFEDVIQNS